MPSEKLNIEVAATKEGAATKAEEEEKDLCDNFETKMENIISIMDENDLNKELKKYVSIDEYDDDEEDGSMHSYRLKKEFKSIKKYFKDAEQHEWIKEENIKKIINKAEKTWWKTKDLERILYTGKEGEDNDLKVIKLYIYAAYRYLCLNNIEHKYKEEYNSRKNELTDLYNCVNDIYKLYDEDKEDIDDEVIKRIGEWNKHYMDIYDIRKIVALELYDREWEREWVSVKGYSNPNEDKIKSALKYLATFQAGHHMIKDAKKEVAWSLVLCLDNKLKDLISYIKKNKYLYKELNNKGSAKSYKSYKSYEEYKKLIEGGVTREKAYIGLPLYIMSKYILKERNTMVSNHENKQRQKQGLTWIMASSRKHFPRTPLSKVGAKILLTLVNKRNKSIINDLYNYVTSGNGKAKKRLVNKMASVYHSKHKNKVKVRGEFNKVLVAMKC